MNVRSGVLQRSTTQIARVFAYQPFGERDLPEFQDRIEFVEYVAYADILIAANDPDVAQLAEFLRERIRNVLG